MSELIKDLDIIAEETKTDESCAVQVSKEGKYG